MEENICWTRGHTKRERVGRIEANRRWSPGSPKGPYWCLTSVHLWAAGAGLRSPKLHGGQEGLHVVVWISWKNGRGTEISCAEMAESTKSLFSNGDTWVSTLPWKDTCWSCWLHCQCSASQVLPTESHQTPIFFMNHYKRTIEKKGTRAVNVLASTGDTKRAMFAPTICGRQKKL